VRNVEFGIFEVVSRSPLCCSADDAVLLASSDRDLLRSFAVECEAAGMRVSESKI